MNSSRPVIRLSRGALHNQPKPRKVQPKQSRRFGPCLVCGDTFEGPTSIRLKHGCIVRRNSEVEFVTLPFDDNSTVKWLCMGCALDNAIVAEDVSGFSQHLQGLSADGQCCLCREVIEPYPLEEWSSAILIEFGDMTESTKGPFSIFVPRASGHLHYFCTDELNLELWRLIERSDEPDYREYLPSCK
jgi:hypothetical protein